MKADGDFGRRNLVLRARFPHFLSVCGWGAIWNIRIAIAGKGNYDRQPLDAELILMSLTNLVGYGPVVHTFSGLKT